MKSKRGRNEKIKFTTTMDWARVANSTRPTPHFASADSFEFLVADDQPK